MTKSAEVVVFQSGWFAWGRDTQCIVGQILDSQCQPGDLHAIRSFEGPSMSIGIYFLLLLKVSWLVHWLNPQCKTRCACKLSKPICQNIFLFNLSIKVELPLIVDQVSNLTRGEKINWKFRPFLVDEFFTYSGARPPILRCV